jgi:hypothetical protein
MHIQPGLVVSGAGEEPIHITLGVWPEVEACEQRGGRNLGRPEACGSEASVDVPLQNLVEDLLRLGALPRLLQVDLNAATRKLLTSLANRAVGSPSPDRCVPQKTGMTKRTGSARAPGPGRMTSSKPATKPIAARVLRTTTS